MDENNPFYKIDGGSMRPLGRAFKEYVKRLKSFDCKTSFLFALTYSYDILFSQACHQEIKRIQEVLQRPR